jgi:hypothetical protein
MVEVVVYLWDMLNLSHLNLTVKKDLLINAPLPKRQSSLVL